MVVVADWLLNSFGEAVAVVIHDCKLVIVRFVELWLYSGY